MKLISTFLIVFFCLLASVRGAEPRFPVLANDQAWEMLPDLLTGSRDVSLPVWARAFARSIPATTAAMLEMDYVYRVENPLEAQLRAKIRWVVARADGSRYGMSCAEADLIRAGGRSEDLHRMDVAGNRIPEREARVLAFAQKLAEAGYEVTDEEVEKLLADWGPEQVTAMVMTVAYGAFQDRLLIVSGIESETQAWNPPPHLQFDWEELKKQPLPPIARVTPSVPGHPPGPIVQAKDPEWQAAPYDDLRNRLGQQQLRGPRIPIPPDDVVEQKTPPGTYPPGQAAKIRWNCVTYGYQPQLTHAWFFTMRRFRDESQLPDDFRQSLFWVVTRANQCFY